MIIMRRLENNDDGFHLYDLNNNDEICFKFQMGLPPAHAYNSPVPLYSQVSANIALLPQSHLFQTCLSVHYVYINLN